MSVVSNFQMPFEKNPRSDENWYKKVMTMGIKVFALFRNRSELWNRVCSVLKKTKWEGPSCPLRRLLMI